MVILPMTVSNDYILDISQCHNAMNSKLWGKCSALSKGLIPESADESGEDIRKVVEDPT